ncbi:SanA protein [Mesocricetibacter intestinalis]|uniref:SanA protein n=1 Tax=Mesocricetibacter intestinalis TaxID=1521930 RepID=A0A4V3DA06_9PAST|nr:ElyC/SanA/YdcF family protein [Mesocricetibacter intestinalis]TDQ59112.1 SanA protein [Mesocricetibacter intestinalis]
MANNERKGFEKIFASVFLRGKSRLTALLRPLLCTAATLLLVILLLDLGVGLYVRKAIYTDAQTIPHRPYGMVLGTSKYFINNSPNLFYHYRLQAAEQLFKTGKIDYLLLSGDNRTLQYNEPRTMQRDLKKNGIEDRFLFPDYAGFRTLDSVIRAKQVFHATPMTIITQRFQCERALFIAKYYHIDAICFAAEYPKDYIFVRFREVFARLQMLWDLATEKTPYFLGAPEPLPAPALNPATP